MRVLLMYSTHTPSRAHRDRLGALGTDVLVAHDERSAKQGAQEADIILGHRYLRQVLPSTLRLRWVQSTAGGVDRLPLDTLRDLNVMLTRMTIASPTIARHAVTLAWALTRRLPETFQNQSSGTWAPPTSWPPVPRRALILGTGAIGKEIAALLRRDGVEVTGLRRRVHEPLPNFDRLVSPGDWRAELPHIDWLFVALPYSPDIQHMVGEAELRALPPHAILVNVGRGETVDTDALRRVLTDGHLAGAALDVVHPKPTSPDDPLWQTPHLLITPHVAAHAAGRSEQIEAFSEAQVRRFLNDEPLLDIVDLS